MTDSSAGTHALVRACVDAAASLGVRRRFPEFQLEKELLGHLETAAESADARREYVDEEWRRRPGAIDLYGYADGGGRIRWAAELKVDHVEWTLWDLFKLTALATRADFEAGFLVVLAAGRAFESTACGELLPVVNVAAEFASVDRFKRNRRAWCDLLYDGTGRPSVVPRNVRLCGVVQTSVPTWPGYELRVARIERSGRDLVLVGDDGWPDEMSVECRQCPESRGYVDCGGYLVPKRMSPDKAQVWILRHGPKLGDRQRRAVSVHLTAQEWPPDELKTVLALLMSGP